MPDNQNSSEWRVPDDYRNQASGYRAGWADAMACKPAPAMLNGVEGQWEAADRVIAEAYPDINGKGPGFWGDERIPNWGILRLAIARALRAADNRDAAGVVLRCVRCSLGYARIPKDGRCHACGALVSAYPTPTAAPAGEAVAWPYQGDTLVELQRLLSHMCDTSTFQPPNDYNLGFTAGCEMARRMDTHPPAAEVREVDAAMVERALALFSEDEQTREYNPRVMRAILAAALSPPGRAEGGVCAD